MTHASACTPLSPETAQKAQMTADVWRLRGFTDEADNLLAILGMPLPHPIDRGGCTDPRCTSCAKGGRR